MILKINIALFSLIFFIEYYLNKLFLNFMLMTNIFKVIL